MAEEERYKLKAGLRAVAEGAQHDLGAHLTVEELIAYQSGEVPAEEEAELQDHLAVCRECTTLLLDLAAFPSLDQTGARQLSSAEIAAAWRSMQSRVKEGKRTGDAPAPWWQRVGTVFFPLRLSYAIATSLLIMSVGLGAWVVLLWQENQRLASLNDRLSEQGPADVAVRESLEEARRRLDESSRRAEKYETEIAKLQQSVDELSQPQLNVPIADLYPREFVRGQEGPVKTIEVPSGAKFFTLILNITGQPSHPEYGLEILDRRGKLVWRGQGLHLSRFNNFTVTLPRTLLSAGRYRIKLFGLRGRRRNMVEEYALRIRYQG